jgi:hypothetical protein
MEDGGIEVRPVRPDEGLHLRVDLDLGKKLGIPERTLELTFEDRLEIDLP